jgi:hypothetical protein
MDLKLKNKYKPHSNSPQGESVNPCFLSPPLGVGLEIFIYRKSFKSLANIKLRVYFHTLNNQKENKNEI